MRKVEQVGNKQVASKGSITRKNTAGVTPANHHVAPSLRAAGSISDRGVWMESLLMEVSELAQ